MQVFQCIADLLQRTGGWVIGSDLFLAFLDIEIDAGKDVVDLVKQTQSEVGGKRFGGAQVERNGAEQILRFPDCSRDPGAGRATQSNRSQNLPLQNR